MENPQVRRSVTLRENLARQYSIITEIYASLPKQTQKFVS